MDGKPEFGGGGSTFVVEEIANCANKGNGVDERLLVAAILLEVGVHIPNYGQHTRLH